MRNCIEFHGVSKSFDANALLSDFCLDIPSLKTTALVGESGSGKSTLLQLANGLLRPDSGRVLVLGEPLVPEIFLTIRRRTGYAIQGAGLFPHLTVAENITLVARLSGWSDTDIQSRKAQLFEILQLQDELNARYPHTLSGGQQQRVSLCRAMMLNPQLLLLDEPFSALDPLTRAAIHEEFLRIQTFESRSILLVTHDMQEAMLLAQHIVILRNGAIVQQGDVESVQREPVDDYVRLLLGQRALS